MKHIIAGLMVAATLGASGAAFAQDRYDRDRGDFRHGDHWRDRDHRRWEHRGWRGHDRGRRVCWIRHHHRVCTWR